jgi:hypothetical protein
VFVCVLFTRYKLVHDPENWVTVDEKSGVVTTKKQIDRESPHVNDSFYTIIVHAVDNGEWGGKTGNEQCWLWPPKGGHF